MIFNSHWHSAWSAAITNHLWQSTLMILVAWLLTIVLRRNSARTRYWIWMAASLKLLVPFSVLTAIGHSLRPADAPALAIDNSRLAGAIAMAHPFLQDYQSAQVFPAESVFAPLAQTQHHVVLPELVVALWAVGVLFLLLRWSRDWLGIRRMLRSASRVSLNPRVPVYLTSQAIEPGVVGIFRPLILLPEQLLERLPVGQLHSILEHEICHVRRRDNLMAAMHMLVEAIFWFHPAVWWIERRLIEERERACDEAVLRLGNEAEVYAESILNVCKICTEAPMICVSGVTGSELKQRILRIMTKQVGLELDWRRKVLLCFAGVAAVSTPLIVGAFHLAEVHAQSLPAARGSSIAATWQGTLHTDRDYRFVIKIETAGDGALQGTFYNLDGRPGGMPATSTTLAGSLLKIDFGFATYQGTVSADGGSVKGTWSQGSDQRVLILARASTETAWTIPRPPPRVAPMSQDIDPTFEVATIKPSSPEARGPRYSFEPRRFSVTRVTLSQLVQFAYRVQEREIAGAPGWFDTETYDISAVPGGQGEPSIRQWQTMMKKLMADRFQLKFHNEGRELGVYAVTLAKGGPKFKKSQGDPNGIPGLGFGPGNMGATNATMADIAEAWQQGALDGPVVDQTGLMGRYDLSLRWTPDASRPAQENTDVPPDFYTAVQEQLGLKVISTRAQVEVIVIDQVARPSPN